MTFIDWSDSEEMLGLLCEYVADELSESQDDVDRRTFLSGLSSELTDLANRCSDLSAEETIDRLRIIHSGADEFAGDPVLAHLDDCIEELERIKRQSS